MKPIATLLIEDEEAARQRLERLLAADKDFRIEKSCSNAMEALPVLSEKKIDLLLVDIEMPGMSGIELVSSLNDNNRPLIVFITAYDEYAVQAFEYYAVDYILKPFTNQRFEKMLARIRQHFINEKTINNPWTGVRQFLETHQFPDNRIAVKTGKKYRFIDPLEIAYVCAEGNYCAIRLGSGEKFIHRDTITHLLSILPENKFIRIHHSYIVAIASVQQVNRVAFGEMEIKMNDGQILKVSRKYKDHVRKLLKK